MSVTRSLRFRIRPTGFKHTGLFPEQAVNWDLLTDLIQNSGGPMEVLNLLRTQGVPH
jgi:23S rRNA (cytosine1962-C5)-methyltransferase